MSNRFIRDRKITQEESSVKFIGGNINTQAIVEAGTATSGNKMVDMAFDTAIKLATKLEDANRKNELAQAEITADSNLKEYEAQWSGVNKFSNENFSKYKEGLNEVFSTNKKLLQDSSFTKKEDIDKWDLRNERNKADSEYTTLGQKNQYDIKEAIGKTTLMAEGLMNLSAYETNPTKSNEYLTQALGNLNSLKGFVDEVELLKLKTNILNKSTSTRLENQIQDITNNPNYSLEKKMELIKNVKSGISNSSPYEQTINGLVKSGAINKADAETILNNNMAYTQDYVNKTDGMISRLHAQIENQRYQEEQKTLTAQRQLQKSYTDEILSVDSNIRSGNNNIAISKVEGQPFTPDEIMGNSIITTKYFGATTEKIINNDGYISVISTTETSRMKSEIESAKNSGASRSDSIRNAIDVLNEYAPGSTARKNMERNLVARGVLPSYEIELYTDNTDDIRMINNISNVSNSDYGKFNYSDISKYNNEFTGQMNGLTLYQQSVATKAIIGAMNTGEIVIGVGNKPNAVGANLAYRNSAENRTIINSIIKRASTLKTMPIKETKPKRESFKDAIDNKYKEKDILLKETMGVKRKTVERPTITVEDTSYDYTEYMLD